VKGVLPTSALPGYLLGVAVAAAVPPTLVVLAIVNQLVAHWYFAAAITCMALARCVDLWTAEAMIITNKEKVQNSRFWASCLQIFFYLLTLIFLVSWLVSMVFKLMNGEDLAFSSADISKVDYQQFLTTSIMFGGGAKFIVVRVGTMLVTTDILLKAVFDVADDKLSEESNEKLLAEWKSFVGDHPDEVAERVVATTFAINDRAWLRVEEQWVKAKVVHVFQEDTNVEGVSVVAGSLRVRHQAGVTLVVKDQISTLLKKVAAKSQLAASVSGSVPTKGEAQGQGSLAGSSVGGDGAAASAAAAASSSSGIIASTATLSQEPSRPRTSGTEYLPQDQGGTFLKKVRRTTAASAEGGPPGATPASSSSSSMAAPPASTAAAGAAGPSTGGAACSSGRGEG